MWNESSASRETWIEFALDCHRVGRQSETGGRNTDWPIRFILVEHEPVGWTRFMQRVVERFVLRLSSVASTEFSSLIYWCTVLSM
jgi:hypothetical protein